MGLEFEQMSPDVDEKAFRSDNAMELTLVLAAAKSRALQARITEPSILITSDQVVTYMGVIREKPVDTAQARDYLRSYRDNPAKAVTAVMVFNTATRRAAHGIDVATVFFKDLTDEAIERMIEEGSVMSCCGAFAASLASQNSPFEMYIDHIDGERESVVGLPKKLTKSLIERVSK
jgi:septum formation protein